jgi:hypothetical protein
MARLRALVELGRIEVLFQRTANRTRHIAIAGVRNALQETSNLLEERISILHRQRAGCGEDRGDLTVGQPERHAADSAAGASAYAIWRP